MFDTSPLLPPEELYGIIGHPLGHSLSPLLFTTLFAATARPAAYFRWDVSPEQVDDFMRAVRVLHIRGASVTIPHKEAVLPFLDAVSERARRAGAVNTLYWEGERLCGDNTDIGGFLAPLEKRQPRRALVLGNGGAARAVLAGLLERGVECFVAGRSRHKAEALARDFGASVLPWEECAHAAWPDADLLVNATPLGMQGAREGETPFPSFPKTGNNGDRLAYDLVYRPRPTRFLREAAAAGWATQDGLAMFLAQALEQFRLWTGEIWTPDMAALAKRTLAFAEDEIRHGHC